MRGVTLVRVFCGFCVFLVAVLCNLRLNQISQSVSTSHLETLQRRKMDPVFFKTLTFGHLPAALDWWFLVSLQDSAVSKVPPGVHPELYYGLDLVSELDPAYFEVYQAGANLLTVLRGDGTGARDLLIKGDRFVRNELGSYPQEFKEQVWPRAWNIPMLLGYVYLFHLDDILQAAGAFKYSSELPNAPSYLARLDQKLSRVGGPYEVGLKLTDFMLLGAKDERVRERLTQRKFNLSVNYELFKMNQLLKASGFKLGGSKLPARDPWGGIYSIDSTSNSERKVMTTTPHEPVFGLRGD